MIPGLFVAGSGMCCSVGASAPASRAAIRAGLDSFEESEFDDDRGAPVIVARLPLGDVWGPRRLARMFEAALSECLRECQSVDPGDTVLLLVVAERGRPGYSEHWVASCFHACSAVSPKPFHAASCALPLGRAGLAFALAQAHALLSACTVRRVIVAGVDSYLNASTINHLVRDGRLLSRASSDGFIPGEGAGALVLELAAPGRVGLHVLGTGTSEVPDGRADPLPARATALTRAVRAALAASGTTMEDLDFRMTDVSGESARFREAALADTRLLNHRSRPFPILHLADVIGETGAAVGALSLAYLAGAMGRGHVPGTAALAHFSNDGAARAAVILKYVVS